MTPGFGDEHPGVCVGVHNVSCYVLDEEVLGQSLPPTFAKLISSQVEPSYSSPGVPV